MVMIKIDRDMLLTELYELRAAITEIAVEASETAAARAKIDQLASLVANAPQDNQTSGLPRISARRG